MAESGDRRPIAARERAVTQRVAGWLVRRGASADGISLAGMVAGLLAGLSRAAVAWTRLDAPVWLPGALAKAGPTAPDDRTTDRDRGPGPGGDHGGGNPHALTLATVNCP